MKRHSRPYGCTFPNCSKAFGSKNDWKRHENSQHFHLETWRCDETEPQGGVCAKVCYRKSTFEDHLKKDHSISNSDAVKTKLDSCHIGRNCQARFWCGFCNKLIELKKKGVGAWTERFNHIDDHFMGRNGLPKQNIQYWIPMINDKPREDGQKPRSLDLFLEKEDGEDSCSSSGTSIDSASDDTESSSGSPAHANSPEDHVGSFNKRKQSGNSSYSPPAKRASVPHTRPFLIYCVSSSASGCSKG